MSLNTIKSQTFKAQQLKHKRVKTAFSEKEKMLGDTIKAKYRNAKPGDPIILVAYKDEENLEVWIKPSGYEKYKLLLSYPFCSTSGILGPKRQEGDLQIPEGFYHIRDFNPYSNFYLSMGINYPNRSDRILGHPKRPGSNIYIHGDCATIGCIPITDDKIKELYVLAVLAKNNGQKIIPVYIFPTRLEGDDYILIKETYKNNKDVLTFWENIKTGYDLFIKNHNKLNFTINSKGKYIFN